MMLDCDLVALIMKNGEILFSKSAEIDANFVTLYGPHICILRPVREKGLKDGPVVHKSLLNIVKRVVFNSDIMYVDMFSANNFDSLARDVFAELSGIQVVGGDKV